MEKRLKTYEEYEQAVEQSKKLDKGSKEYKALRKEIIFFEKNSVFKTNASFDEMLELAVTTKKEKS